MPSARARFPFICVLASGGHNLVTLCRGVGSHTILGLCLDDAMGEAFEKTARLLHLDASGTGGGGAALEKFATLGNPKAFPNLPVPLRNQRGPKTCDFSFAGLKTSVRMALEKELGEGWAPSDENASVRADLAAGFQRCAVKHLEERTDRACEWAKSLCERDGLPAPRQLVLAGGVAANSSVRASIERICGANDLELVAPPPRWCTDNGVMVAWCGAERLLRDDGVLAPPETAEPLEGEKYDLRARWPLGDDAPRRELAEEAARARKAMTPSSHKRGNARAAAARMAKGTPYDRRKRVHAPLGDESRS